MITIKEVLIIHQLAITQFGGSEGVRDFGLLESAIQRPFVTFGNEELYPTATDKAAAIVESIVKNHPFVDGNKRSGAFAFVWFLQKVKLLNPASLSPSALTTLTLLLAESAPKEKTRMIGLILLLLKK